ncbi:hypothetical protein GCM10010972_12510 [Cellulomonas carbonis]|nr:hypothetical protein GCM10010972_12510 [Cellulomonas carbonis]
MFHVTAAGADIQAGPGPLHRTVADRRRAGRQAGAAKNGCVTVRGDERRVKRPRPWTVRGATDHHDPDGGWCDDDTPWTMHAFASRPVATLSTQTVENCVDHR